VKTKKPKKRPTFLEKMIVKGAKETSS